MIESPAAIPASRAAAPPRFVPAGGARGGTRVPAGGRAAGDSSFPPERSREVRR